MAKISKKTTLTIKGCPILEDNKIMIEVDGFAEKISLIDYVEDFLESGECTITFAQSNDEA